MRGDGSGRSARPTKTLAARAIAMLARREFSRAELRRKLLAAGDETDAAEVDRVLDDIVALGYLSDARFSTPSLRKKSGSHSKRAIGATLKAHGVDTEAASPRSRRARSTTTLRWSHCGAQVRNCAGERPGQARQVRFLQSRGLFASAILKLMRARPPAQDGPIAVRATRSEFNRAALGCNQRTRYRACRIFARAAQSARRARSQNRTSGSSPMKYIRALCCAALLAVIAAPTLAQSWPSKPIKLIVPFTPGGSQDVIGRLFSKKSVTRSASRSSSKTKPERRTDCDAGSRARRADGLHAAPVHGRRRWRSSRRFARPSATRRSRISFTSSIWRTRHWCCSRLPLLPVADARDAHRILEGESAQDQYGVHGNGTYTH
jgi:regulatory protein